MRRAIELGGSGSQLAEDYRKRMPQRQRPSVGESESLRPLSSRRLLRVVRGAVKRKSERTACRSPNALLSSHYGPVFERAQLRQRLRRSRAIVCMLVHSRATSMWRSGGLVTCPPDSWAKVTRAKPTPEKA